MHRKNTKYICGQLKIWCITTTCSLEYLVETLASTCAYTKLPSTSRKIYLQLTYTVTENDICLRAPGTILGTPYMVWVHVHVICTCPCTCACTCTLVVHTVTTLAHNGVSICYTKIVTIHCQISHRASPNTDTSLQAS